MGRIRISVDYEAAMAHARTLDMAADKCGEALAALKKQSGASENYWTGRAGTALRSHMNDSVKELAGVQSQLHTTAANIRRIAEELKKKDEKIKSFI